jgi:hypothetical protein
MGDLRVEQTEAGGHGPGYVPCFFFPRGRTDDVKRRQHFSLVFISDNEGARDESKRKRAKGSRGSTSFLKEKGYKRRAGTEGSTECAEPRKSTKQLLWEQIS